MRVIKPGIDPQDVAQQATCHNCHAVIEFMPREVERVSDQRDGDFYQFNCPCCGKSTTRQCHTGYYGPG